MYNFTIFGLTNQKVFGSLDYNIITVEIIMIIFGGNLKNYFFYKKNILFSNVAF